MSALVGLDWGTTSLRAFLITCEGGVVRRVDREAGISKLKEHEFEPVMDDVLAALEAPHHVPVIACGMITSRQGWIEVPYCPCPATADHLVAGLHRHLRRDGMPVWFVPGLSCRDPQGLPDVMRGEETQLLGALEDNDRRLVVLPGTHSKWALLAAQHIETFKTFMTGELYGLLKSHSILARSMRGDAYDERGFDAGVAVTLASGSGSGGLISHLFAARTLTLFDELEPEATASWLSGLLIASELEAGSAMFERPDETLPIVLIGEERLVALYERAATARGLATSRGAAEPAAQGLHRIADAAGLLQ